MGIRLFMAVQTPAPETMTRKLLMMTAAVNMRKEAATAMATQQVITATVITM